MFAAEFNKVSKSFGAIRALKEISLRVEEGKIFGFIGPDGSGKTTLFRILATLLLPDKGSVTVLGLDAVKDYRKIRSSLGYMPGRFSLYQDLSVEENLKFYATIFGTTVSENYHLIKNIYNRLEAFRKRPAGKLSGGMKQKLALCCALIHKPEFLILDEPTTGVDAVSRMEFWDILKDLMNDGLTIIVSTPYMDEAMLCSRVALMQNGEIMKNNTPQEIVKEYPKKLFKINTDHIYSLINDLKTYNDTWSAHPFGQTVHYTGKSDNDDTTALSDFLRQKGHDHFSIQRTEPGIEDCFMELMVKS